MMKKVPSDRVFLQYLYSDLKEFLFYSVFFLYLRNTTKGFITLPNRESLGCFAYSQDY